MSRLIHSWMGRGTQQKGMWGSIGANYMNAGDNGFGDTQGPSHVQTMQHIQSRAWIQAPYANTYGVNNGLEAIIAMSHYAVAVVTNGNQCWIDWDFPQKLRRYSFRFNMSFDGNLIYNFVANGGMIGFLQGYDGNTEKWRLELRPEEYVIPTGDVGRQLRIKDSYRIAQGLSGTQYSNWSSYSIGGQPPGGQIRARIEGRVVDNVITINIYENYASQTGAQRDAIKSSQTFTLADGDITNLSFGVRPASTVLRPVWGFGAIQIWDDTTNPDPWPRGQYTPSPPTWERVTGPGVTEPLTTEGVVTSTSPFTVTSKVAGNFGFYNEYRESGYNSYPDITYHDAGTYQFKLDLFKPNEAIYPGPHPIVPWIHGGFFISGGRDQIPMDWVKKLCEAGYAVASIEYPLCATILTGPSPDPYINKHPKQIQFCKRAVWWLKQNAATYNLNPNKIVVSGFSAGAYLALATGLTYEMSSINGFNTTMRNYFGGTDQDVAVQGIFAYAPPVNWAVMKANDITGVGGIMTITAKTYMGKGSNESDISDAADINDYVTPTSYKPPIGFVRGTQDEMIVAGNTQALIDAYTPYFPAAKLNTYEIVASHDNTDTVNDPLSLTNGIVPWMNNLFGGAPTRVDP